MVIKKQSIFRDEERPISSEIKKNEEQWEELGELAKDTLKLDFDGDAEKAIDFKSSGRRCPSCTDLLRVKEVTDNGVKVVYCWSCHKTYHNDDLNTIDEVTDALYRSIPDSAVLHWMKFRDNVKGKA